MEFFIMIFYNIIKQLILTSALIARMRLKFKDQERIFLNEPCMGSDQRI